MERMERLDDQAEVFHRVPHITLKRVGNIKFIDTPAVRIEYVPSRKLIERLAFNKISIIKLPPSVYDKFCETNRLNPLMNPSVVHTRFGAVYVVRSFVRSNPSKPGRPRKVTGDMLNLIVSLRRAGYSFGRIAKQLGLSKRTVWKWFYHATKEEPTSSGIGETIEYELSTLATRTSPFVDSNDVKRKKTFVVGGTSMKLSETFRELFQTVRKIV